MPSPFKPIYGLAAVFVLVWPAIVLAGQNLGDAEIRGKRIYVTGQGKQAILARLIGPGIDTPATGFPCIQCHKEGGEGAREGGVLAPDITRDNLTIDHSGIRQTGRQHPPYDETTLKRAIREGVDPAGNALHPAMPRYKLDEADLADLLAFLKVLGKEPVPGVDDGYIRIGILKPVSGPLAPVGQAVAMLLAGFFEELNALGGLYGRNVELVAVEFNPAAPPDVMLEAVLRHLAEVPVFCFVGNLGVPDDHPVARYFADEGIPVFAPLSIHAGSSFAGGGSIFYIQSSLYDQARVLMDYFSINLDPDNKKIALVHAGDSYGKGAAAGARVQSHRHGLEISVDTEYAAHAFVARDAVENLKASQLGAVFFFGAGEDMRNFIAAADAIGFKVPVLGLAELAGLNLLSLPAGSSGRVFLATPLHVPDPLHSGTRVYYRLLKKFNISGRYASFLSSAFAGTRLLEEGMRRAGRDVTRAKLVKEVGNLWQFETGMTPNLTYNENRRTGLTGAALLRFDPEKKRYLPAGDWREPLAAQE